MKNRRLISRIVSLLFLFSIIFFSTEIALPQSGREAETTEEKILTIQNPNEQKPNEIDYSKLESYDYIEPTNIQPFLKVLNEFGAKGYQIKNITQIPYQPEEIIDGKSSVNIAGVVKLGEGRYEYKFVIVEETLDLAGTLNKESQIGFNPREIITFVSSQEVNVSGNDGISRGLEALLSAPQMHNLVLLEYETGKKIEPREFMLLKAGTGIGKNPTERMQSLLDETEKQNYIPVGVFLSIGFTGPQPEGSSWKLIDNYYGCLLEKTSEKQNLEIQFVRAALHGSFKKRVNKLAQEGFKVSSVRFMEGLMYKDLDESDQPVNYKWINAASKKLDEELRKLSNAGAKLRGKSMVRDFWLGGISETNLIFELPVAAEKIRYEYKSLKMVSEKPQTVLIGKTTIAPDAPVDKFREIIKQGYTFASLVCTGDKVTAVFERQVSNNNQ